MASLGHVAVGMAAGRLASPGAPPRQRWTSMALYAALAMLPDLDVIGFGWDVKYEAPWGHRGAAHSILVALGAGAAFGLVSRSKRAWLLGTLTVLSHGALDAMTTGGLGVAAFWPWSDVRHFFPLRPIPVAPIGLHFLSLRGLRCTVTELVLLAPCWLYAVWPERRRAA